MAVYNDNDSEQLPYEEADAIFAPRGTEIARGAYNMTGRSYMHQEPFDADDDQNIPAGFAALGDAAEVILGEGDGNDVYTD